MYNFNYTIPKLLCLQYKLYIEPYNFNLIITRSEISAGDCIDVANNYGVCPMATTIKNTSIKRP